MNYFIDNLDGRHASLLQSRSLNFPRSSLLYLYPFPHNFIRLTRTLLYFLTTNFYYKTLLQTSTTKLARTRGTSVLYRC